MVNTLPAILIGGPPHAGKSVLFYSLTHALRQLGIRHHAIRACPDGEGNWTQESNAETVSQIRKPLKGEWPDSFVKRICQDLEHRCLPLLVDMGGHPKESQMCILRECTHAVLLLRADEPNYTQLWQRLVTECDLLLLAQIYSQLDGISTITTHAPVLEGTLTGLERYNTTLLAGPMFDALVDSIAALFNSYSPQDLEKANLEQAPTELVLNLPVSLHALASSQVRWEPEMLTPFLAGLPVDVPLSVYGVGPNWLYAALAGHVTNQPFYQFDPRLGWLQPVPVYIGSGQFSDVSAETNVYQDVTVLSLKIPSKHLDYFQPYPLPFPSVRTNGGLIIEGVIPHWLLTALLHLYKEAGVAWIAVYYPQSTKAIVAYSRVETHHPSDYVPIPVQ